jgi:hypothetical protein
MTRPYRCSQVCDDAVPQNRKNLVNAYILLLLTDESPAQPKLQLLLPTKRIGQPTSVSEKRSLLVTLLVPQTGSFASELLYKVEKHNNLLATQRQLLPIVSFSLVVRPGKGPSIQHRRTHFGVSLHCSSSLVNTPFVHAPTV